MKVKTSPLCLRHVAFILPTQSINAVFAPIISQAHKCLKILEFLCRRSATHTPTLPLLCMNITIVVCNITILTYIIIIQTLPVTTNKTKCGANINSQMYSYVCTILECRSYSLICKMLLYSYLSSS